MGVDRFDRTRHKRQALRVIHQGLRTIHLALRDDSVRLKVRDAETRAPVCITITPDETVNGAESNGY